MAKSRQPYDVRKEPLSHMLKQESCAKWFEDWLEKERSQQEEVVLPYLSRQKVQKNTKGYIIRFRGENRKLEPPAREKERRHVIICAYALQYYDCLQHARSNGDTDVAVLALQGFQALTFEIFSFIEYGKSFGELLTGIDRRREGSRKGGQRSAKLKGKEEQDFITNTYSDIMQCKTKISPTAACRQVAARLKKEKGISAHSDTVRRNLP